MSEATAATKPCPMCGEEILAVARKCRYCQTYLDPSARPPDEVPSAAERMLLPVGRPASAIAAGYLGLFAFLPGVAIITGTLAVICGVMALKEIKRNPSLSGKGRAWFGIIVGAPMAALSALYFIVLIGRAIIETQN